MDSTRGNADRQSKMSELKYFGRPGNVSFRSLYDTSQFLDHKIDIERERRNENLVNARFVLASRRRESP